MKFAKILGIAVVVIIAGIFSAFFVLNGNGILFENIKTENITFEITPFNLKVRGDGMKAFSMEEALFQVVVYEGEHVKDSPTGVPFFSQFYFEPKPENEDIYKEIGIKTEPQKTIVVLPIFTMTAYGVPGFYSYYFDKCDTKCIKNIPIRYDLSPTSLSSVNTITVLRLLGYSFLTDIEVDKNPEILEQYDKVILLHNEYVTRTEFDAITQHPKVLYLHPNALYAEISVNYEKDTITLLRGHGYPEQIIKNGFDWEFDNSPLEYDYCKEGWEFNEIDNGKMLSCYPSHIIFKDYNLLKMIKDY